MKSLGGIALAAFAFLAPVQAVADGHRFNWTGAYIGVHTGGISADMTAEDGRGGYFTHAAGRKFEFEGQGANIGAQFGYQSQMGRWVLGNELMVSSARLQHQIQSPYFTTDVANAKLHPLIALTGKIGYAFDRTLPYVRMGYAGADMQFAAHDRTNGVFYRQNEWHSGYLIGAGLDTAITDGLILGAEYNYIDLGLQSHAGTNTLGGNEVYHTDAKIHSFTARLNVLFGDRGRSYGSMK